MAQRPSDPLAHQVSRPGVLSAWRELVVRTVRFGRDAPVGDGVRRELLNARVVITEPGGDDGGDDDRAELARHGYDLDDLRAYGHRMLDGRPPADGVAYTYGHRLRTYDGDALAVATERLRAEPGTRRAYLSLWDTGHDLPGEHSAPCLVAVVLRIVDDRLTLTATFRAHNLLTAWVPNAYGLLAVARHVAGALDLPVGPLTVISHQLGADPDHPRYPVAAAIEADWSRDEDPGSTLREDPHGYFVVTTDPEAGEIVAEHRAGPLLITTYRGRSARVLAQRISADMAVSLPSHALWLGGELARAETRLPPST